MRKKSGAPKDDGVSVGPLKLKVTVDSQTVTCDRSVYVKSKTKQLRQFGYSNLTESEVDEQVTAVLEGKKVGGGLTVIGGFIEGEIQAV